MSMQGLNIDEQLERARQLFRSLAEVATGLPCVIAPYDGPTPANQYCSVWVKELSPEQYDIQYTGFNEDGDFYIDQKNETYLKVEFKAFGQGALAALEKVISELKSPERGYSATDDEDPLERIKNAPLWQYLGYGGHDNIQDISTVVLGKVLPQAVVNVYFYANLSTVKVIEGFDVVDLNVSVRDNKEDIFTVKIGGQQNVNNTD